MPENDLVYERSFFLLSPETTCLLIVDLQERLLPVIAGNEGILKRAIRLGRAAGLLEVPVFLTEQYPKGLGPTVQALWETLPEGTPRFEKKTFSCCESLSLMQALKDRDIQNVLLCGIEAHVCVQQTAFDLLAAGYQVYLATDASGSRSPEDCQAARERMADAGVFSTTSEAAVFEWCRSADHPRFKEISRLIKES